MAQLTVRRVTDQVVRELKLRAAANGRSAEAEHREILRRALLGGSEDFAARAANASVAPYRSETFDLHFRPGIDPLKLNQLVDELEVDAFS